MRAFSRLLCSLAVTASLFLGAPLFADDVPADEAAETRTEEFLNANENVDITGTHRLGLFMQGKLVGCVVVDMKKTESGFDYSFDMNASISGPQGSMKMTHSEAGKLDEDLGLVSSKGTKTQAAGAENTTTTYACEVADGKLKYTSTTDGKENPATDAVVDGHTVSGIEMLACKVWVKLPAGQTHRVHVIECDTGKASVIELVCSEKKTANVGGKDQPAVELTAKNLTKGKSEIYTCCCDTGTIFSMAAEGMPFEVKSITAEEEAAWKAEAGK